MRFFLKAIFLAGVLASAPACLKFKTFGNASGYGGGDPLLSLLRSKTEQMRLVLQNLPTDVLFRLENNVCPSGVSTRYCQAIANLSEPEVIFLRSHLLASSDALDALLLRDNEHLFELVSHSLVDEQGQELNAQTEYGPGGAIQIRDDRLEQISAQELIVLLAQRAFNKVKPNSAFSSNGYPLSQDYVHNYTYYSLFLGKDYSRLLGIGWLLQVYRQLNDCPELTSPQSHSWVFYGSERSLEEQVGGTDVATCARAWEIGSATLGPKFEGAGRGLYQANFSLAIDRTLAGTEMDSAVVAIDVFDSLTNSVIASRVVKHSEFENLQYKKFGLYFDLQANHSKLSFRVRRISAALRVFYLGTLLEGVLGGFAVYPNHIDSTVGGYGSEFGGVSLSNERAMEWNVVETSSLFSASSESFQGAAKLAVFVSFDSSAEFLNGEVLRIRTAYDASQSDTRIVRIDEFSGKNEILTVLLPLRGSVTQFELSYLNEEGRGDSVKVRLHAIAVIPDTSTWSQSDTGSGLWDFRFSVTSSNWMYFTANVANGTYCRYVDSAEFRFVREKEPADPSVVQRNQLPFLYDGGLCDTTHPGKAFRKRLNDLQVGYFRDLGQGQYCETYALHLDPALDLNDEFADPFTASLPLLRFPRGIANTGRCQEYPAFGSANHCQTIPNEQSVLCGPSSEFVDVLSGGTIPAGCFTMYNSPPSGGGIGSLYYGRYYRFCGKIGHEYSWMQNWFAVYTPLQLPEEHYCTEIPDHNSPLYGRYFLCTANANAQLRYRLALAGGRTYWFEPFYVPRRNP
ncbi:MAG: hypothetical protein R3B54_13620 [Bdellovibrionota bacterium]